MEQLAVILSVVGILFMIAKMVRSKSSEKNFSKQWAIIDTTFASLIEDQDLDTIDFEQICSELYQKHGIHKITVIRYFAFYMSIIKEKLMIAISLQNSEKDYEELFAYFTRVNAQIRATASEAPSDFMSFDVYKNVFFYSYDIWLHKEDQKGKSNTRGILLISIHHLYFIPRGIEQSDFKKLFPIASTVIGVADDSGALSTGLNIYRTANELHDSVKPKPQLLTDAFKKELSKRYHKEGGFSIAIAAIKGITIRKILGVPHIYIETDQGSYRLDSHKSPFEDAKDYTQHLKMQFEMAINLHDKTLLPNRLKKPTQWTVIETSKVSFATHINPIS